MLLICTVRLEDVGKEPFNFDQYEENRTSVDAYLANRRMTYTDNPRPKNESETDEKWKYFFDDGREFKLKQNTTVIKQGATAKNFCIDVIGQYIRQSNIELIKDIQKKYEDDTKFDSYTIEFQKDFSIPKQIGKSISGDGKAWLISWNPKNWEWENLAEGSVKTMSGGRIVEPWASANKHPKKGDDVFLLKTGDEPRGIMAHGVVYKESYDAPHYNEEKAAQGKMMNKIDVEFDWIINSYTDEILSKDIIKEKFPEQDWEPQSSGIAIKDKYVSEIKRIWYEFIGQEESIKEVDKKMEKKKLGLNTILYGPPGTGKTYSTVKYAVEICDPEYASTHSKYKELLDRFNELKDKEGRIVFTTFHQSYSYEEFIEGIKPDTDEDNPETLTYKKESGIFKKFCETARRGKIQESSLPLRENPKVWVVLLDGSGQSELKKYCFSHDEIRIGWPECEDTVTKDTPNLNDKERAILHNFQDRMEIGDIVLIEKNVTSIDGLGVITSDCFIDREGYESYPRVRKIKWIGKEIDDDALEINGGVRLDRKSVYGIPDWRVDLDKVYSLISKYEKGNGLIPTDTETPELGNYVFIIDEINRGNISKIFGELITLIEDTKRDGMDEAASAVLPYSGTKFSVPKNVYILGTMNTADRSIALMDTALRRRFDFVEMMPQTDLLDGVTVKTKEGSVNIGQMLKTINERIEFLFDREHTIGHAFFMRLTKEDIPSLSTLSDIFKRSVVPLLQEYFYEDYEKIQLVLGDNGKTNDGCKFIVDKPMKSNSIFITGKNGLEDSVQYSVNQDAFDRIESYAGIIKAIPKTNEASEE